MAGAAAMTAERDAAADVSALAAIRPITPKEFRLFQALIEQESGIHLAPIKVALLEGRLAKRLRCLGLRTYSDYYRLVTEGDAHERQVLIDHVSTNETHFFREPQQFAYLERQVFPAWQVQVAEGQRRKVIRVWSAACSTGEEPYSLAMSLLTHFPLELGWSIDVLATDISTRVLARAAAADYPLSRAAEIPAAYLRRFMLRGTRAQEGKMRPRPDVRSIVRFAHLNLNEPGWASGAAYDLIFCRNVLIYFDKDRKQDVVRRLSGALAPEGLLFLGAAECLGPLAQRLFPVGPAVYAAQTSKARSARA
jgi:chemotaxis protein methyltransferase CheR